MALSARRKLILAALESTYGTAVATAGTNAILVSSPTLTPVTGGTVDRGLVRPYHGGADQIPVNTHQQLECAVELAGPGVYDPSAAAIKTPGWGLLLQACGFSETIGKKQPSDPYSNEVVYAPISGSEPSLTVRANWDDQQHVLAGCRGTARLALPTADIPRWTFTLTGLWADPSSVAAIVPDYGKFQAPRPGSATDTPTVTLFGQSVRMRSLELDLAVEVIHREIIGAANEVLIVDRSPSGTIVLDAQALSTFDPFAAAAKGTTGALQIVHGAPDTSANAGKLIEIDCPRIQLGEPTYAEDNGVLQQSIPFQALPNSGNDEFVVTVR